MIRARTSSQWPTGCWRAARCRRKALLTRSPEARRASRPYHFAKMGTTLAIWKWASRGNAALARRVFDAIAQDEPHDAIVRFDAAALEATIERELREDDEPVFDISRGDFAGQPCN